MLYKNYVGIDVSKLSLDVFIREASLHRKFRNDSSGFALLVQWLKGHVTCSWQSLLICFEHTGLYSLSLAQFLEQEGITYAMVPPLEIKRSLGITRGKNDIVDAKRIAEFAYRFSDKILPTKLPSKDIQKLHFLLTMRDKMMVNIAGYTMAQKELFRVVSVSELPTIALSYQNTLITLKEEVRRIEREIRSTIFSNNTLKTTFELITTVKGIGFIVASFLIVYTCNFTRFKDWRKFACYSGIAPFEYQSGTSVHGRTQVSAIANQQVKRLLHLAAMAAIHFDSELREYYMRRQAEGKSKMATINIVRNKLLARVFAIVKRGTPFVDIHRYAST